MGRAVTGHARHVSISDTRRFAHLKDVKVDSICVGHGGPEVVAGHSGPIVALEVEVHALPETFRGEDGLVHADNLGPLRVDSGRVKVVHGDVRLGTDRVASRIRRAGW